MNQDGYGHPGTSLALKILLEALRHGDVRLEGGRVSALKALWQHGSAVLWKRVGGHKLERAID